ncbi:glycosyltransferase family 4 protein [Ferruginibacter albus]|uniref:glycosyltransferase family 4 protein n=1 Tax=Ferruginibacter albus TaxID=2875540 RepID=UPI001CC3D04B|nr:glycosyltransferase family 4 protein [Ferruginibacter albus]UAY50688.1 glycosyltransferase family 4 protein [Ferruginibacter albus]
MRIIYFLPDIDAGVSRVVKNLIIHRPSDKKVEYAVVLSHNKKDTHKRVTEDFDGVKTFRFEFSPEENLYCVYKRLYELCVKSGEDIFVCNDGWEIRMTVALRLQNPVVYILHGDFGYYYNVVNLNKTIVNCFIAISNKIEWEVHKLLDKKSNAAIIKIYFPVAAAIQTNRQKKSTDGFRILFAGHLEERKGAELIPEIYKKMIEKGMDDFCIDIVGDGVLYEELSQHFKDIKRVSFYGRQSNEFVLGKMKEADVFLFPSKLEGLPNVLIEALGNEAIPIASNLESGVQDIITNNINGILVDNPVDANEFADKITALYNNRSTLLQLRKNCLTGIDKFDPYRQAAAYENVIINVKPIQRIFPEKYIMGGVLNKSWLPNWLVKSIRRMINHPKL